MNLFENKLKEIRKDWGLLREYPDAPDERPDPGFAGKDPEIPPEEEIPEPTRQTQFIWSLGGSPYIITAGSQEEAYEKAIAARMEWGGQDRETAEAWFNQEDNIEQVAGEL